MKFLVNLWAVALPWTVIGQLFVIWNLYLNIVNNIYWAHGNIFLVANTLYVVTQYILSLLLVYENESWLNCKFYRMLSLISGLIYSFVYLMFLLFLFNLVFNWGGREPGVDEIITAMVVAYNLLMNIGILPINFAILAKELSLWFSKQLEEGLAYRDRSLGSSDLL